MLCRPYARPKTCSLLATTSWIVPAPPAVRLNEPVVVTFGNSNETAATAGYDLYKVQRRGRVRVNPALILATGGGPYRVEDEPARGRGRMRRGSFTYFVEEIFDDGRASVLHGPFTVDNRRDPGRRLLDLNR